jgi:hypothetical protein
VVPGGSVQGLALSGEEGGDELGVRVAPAVKIADDRIDIEGDAAMGDGQGLAVVFQENPAGRAAGTGQAGAAGIEGPDAVDETVGGDVSMAADDDVGAASGQQRPELLVGEARFDPGTVVGSG